MAIQKIPGRAIKLGNDTIGDVAYFDGTTWQRLAIGTVGEVLTMNEAGTYPTWGTTWQFQGDYNGYSLGGNENNAPYNLNFDVIERNSYASDTNSVDVGDLTSVKFAIASSWKSMTHGYAAGGYAHYNNPGGGPGGVTSAYEATIEKFSFASSSNGVDTADLTATWEYGGGCSSANNCYIAGGSHSGTRTDTINKFVKSSEANATDIGDLVVPTGPPFASSSTDHGYLAGGTDSNGPVPDAAHNVIQRFSFASGTQNADDVGDLNTATWAGAAGSSLTHGYIACGYNHSNQSSNRIEKYSFASSANATQIGTMTVARGNETLGGTSSTTHGYAAGGIQPGVGTCTIIDKYSFVTDANATDVGDLTSRKTSVSGTQN